MKTKVSPPPAPGCPAHLHGGQGRDGVTCDGSGLPGLPGCSGGDGNKERLCAHTLTLTRTRTRPTQALSKNSSPSPVAKIKEPLGGQPLGGNIAPAAFVVQRALRNLQTPLGPDPGLRWRFPRSWRGRQGLLGLPGLAGGGEPQGARLGVPGGRAALIVHFHS